MTFWIKLFVENVVEFIAKIRISGGSSPRFSPPSTNAHFTHVFTYSALTDGFAGFAKFLSNFRSAVILF